jgi:O-acetyl-ADP-ribose deacetylase (regulator of RNase III)
MLGIRRCNGAQVDVYQGDLTLFACDALVNAANPQLAGGGGVDGAIHRVGGAVIGEECRRIGGCATGQAVATSAGALPARWVIHAVGPVWQGGGAGEDDLLASAYRASLSEAARLGAWHVAFPSLSTGAYGFPIERAAPIAMAAIKRFLEGRGAAREVAPRRVTLVAYSLDDYWVYQEALFAAFPSE